MRSRRGRVLFALAVAGLAVGSFTVASSESATPKVAGPRQVSPLPARASAPPTGEAPSHGVAQPASFAGAPDDPAGQAALVRQQDRRRAPRRQGRRADPRRRARSLGGRRAPEKPRRALDSGADRQLRGRRRTATGSCRPTRTATSARITTSRSSTSRSPSTTATAQLAYGPANINTLFAGTPLCGTHNQGDPVVLYDQFSGRWLASEFATGPARQLPVRLRLGDERPDRVVVRLRVPDPPDEVRRLPEVRRLAEPERVLHDREPVRHGLGRSRASTASSATRCWPASRRASSTRTCTTSTRTSGSFLPADADGSTAPPAGAAIPFVMMRDGAPDSLSVWNGTIDWSAPSMTVTHDTDLSTASFSSNLCGGSWNCIPQPGTSVGLEPLSDRLMHRLAYRNFGGWQTMVVDHTVNAGSNRAGIRWYELTDNGGGWGINQQGTYAPTDGLHRWMGSIAQDASGDLGLGYSVSSSTTYPSIRYTGRLVDRPAGHDASGRGVDHGRRRLAAERLEPLGRLLGDGDRPERRLHVLVHDRVLLDDRRGKLAHPDRRVQVPGLRPAASASATSSAASASTAAASLRPVRPLDRRRHHVPELRGGSRLRTTASSPTTSPFRPERSGRSQASTPRACTSTASGRRPP